MVLLPTASSAITTIVYFSLGLKFTIGSRKILGLPPFIVYEIFLRPAVSSVADKNNFTLLSYTSKPERVSIFLLPN